VSTEQLDAKIRAYLAGGPKHFEVLAELLKADLGKHWPIRTLDARLQQLRAAGALKCTTDGWQIA
jgi:hypothetical protein